MLAVGDNGSHAPVLDAFDARGSMTVCAVDMLGRIRYASTLFREHSRRYYGWGGDDDSFTVDHLAMGDVAYLRERVDVLSKVLDAEGEPVRCIELSGGRAIEHACRSVPDPGNPNARLCVVASTPAVFTGPGCLAADQYNWLMVPTDPGFLGDMTHAELETLRLIALGHSTEEIAERLSRTKKAIERRRMSMRRKLGVEDRQALTRAAMQTGLGHLPESRLSQFVRCCRARQRHLAGESWVSPEPAGV